MIGECRSAVASNSSCSASPLTSIALVLGRLISGLKQTERQCWTGPSLVPLRPSLPAAARTSQRLRLQHNVACSTVGRLKALSSKCVLRGNQAKLLSNCQFANALLVLRPVDSSNVSIIVHSLLQLSGFLVAATCFLCAPCGLVHLQSSSRDQHECTNMLLHCVLAVTISP